MVRLQLRILAGWLLFLFSLQNLATANELNVSVDRNRIYQQDTVNLRIVSVSNKSMSIGGLFSFGAGNIDPPDFSPLQKDFEIVDQTQRYNMQTINGRATAELVWELILSPKKTGKLQIPSLEYEGSTSKPIHIEVLAGRAPRDSSQPPLVFLEVEVDKRQPYVQEQVLFTLRLYASQHLDSGELSAPAHADLIVESFGETRTFYRMAYNQRYEVRERQYLLFPQKSGRLEIAPQHFKGTLIDTRSRRRLRVSETSDALTLEVKAPPASFSGQHWLPATSLHLSESWDLEPKELQVGDSHTRTLEIQALGLLGSALPPLSLEDYPLVKRYPDQPMVESSQHEGGAQGLRRETVAWIAVAPGTVNLPEVRIPWWDTVNDVERVATVPARSIRILPAADTAPSTSPTPAKANSDFAPEASPVILQEGPSQHFWYLLTTLLLLGWGATTWFLLKRGQALPKLRREARVLALDKQLVKAIREQRGDMPIWLIRWAQALHPQGQIRGIADLASWDIEIYQQARAFEASRYAPQASDAIQFNAQRLIERIQAHDRRRQSKPEPHGLRNFYPENQERAA